MAEIEESWARVMAWLAANAPASYATLRPPALPAELDECERGLGVALLAELRRLCLSATARPSTTRTGPTTAKPRSCPGASTAVGG